MSLDNIKKIVKNNAVHPGSIGHVAGTMSLPRGEKHRDLAAGRDPVVEMTFKGTDFDQHGKATDTTTHKKVHVKKEGAGKLSTADKAALSQPETLKGQSASIDRKIERVSPLQNLLRAAYRSYSDAGRDYHIGDQVYGFVPEALRDKISGDGILTPNMSIEDFEPFYKAIQEYYDTKRRAHTSTPEESNIEGEFAKLYINSALSRDEVSELMRRAGAIQESKQIDEAHERYKRILAEIKELKGKTIHVNNSSILDKIAAQRDATIDGFDNSPTGRALAKAASNDILSKEEANRLLRNLPIDSKRFAEIRAGLQTLLDKTETGEGRGTIRTLINKIGTKNDSFNNKVNVIGTVDKILGNKQQKNVGRNEDKIARLEKQAADLEKQYGDFWPHDPVTDEQRAAAISNKPDTPIKDSMDMAEAMRAAEDNALTGQYKPDDIEVLKRHQRHMNDIENQYVRKVPNRTRGTQIPGHDAVRMVRAEKAEDQLYSQMQHANPTSQKRIAKLVDVINSLRGPGE